MRKGKERVGLGRREPSSSEELSLSILSERKEEYELISREFE